MKLLTSKEHSQHRFYVLFALIVLLLFLDNVLLLSVPSFMFVVILVLAASIGDKDELISVCICCIPLSEAIEWHYVVIFCSVIFLLKCGKKVKLDLGIIPLILIVIWEFLHCFFYEANIKLMVSYAFLYMFLIVIFFVRDMKTVDYGFIMRNFSITVFWVCCILVLRLLVYNDFHFDMAFLDMLRLGQTDEGIGGMIINPNSLGVLCVLAVGCLMQVRSTGQKKKLDMLLTISILVLGALTCSRTYLACLLILSVFLLVVSKDGIREKLKFFLGSVSVLSISVLLLYLFFPATLDMFGQRLIAEDITSGRATLFVTYNRYLISSVEAFIWGLGALNLGEKVVNLSISFNVPHNGIQEIMVAWGIIGLLLFVAMIGVLIRRSKQENPHQSGINYALFIVLLAKMMVGQVITSNYTMLSFALIYLSLCQDFSAKKEIDDEVYNSAPKRRNIIKKFCFRKDEKL